MRYQLISLVVVVAITLVGGEGCKRGTKKSVNLNGAGATFPFPLYSKWMSDYHRLDPQVSINYQSIGSGGGIRQITERTVDFGASDAPMTDAQLAKVPGKILHIPATLGAVVVTYNLAGVPKGLKLTPAVIAGIFLGEIKQWNDKELVELNPGISLPTQAITVVHRSDGSGTTAVFTSYLSKVHEGWSKQVGSGTSVNWPKGLGAKGNEGVTGQIKTTPGSIGYIELAYAIQNALPYASIKNRAGQFVEPNLKAITAAAASTAESMPEDLRLSIVDAPGAEAYPLASYSYILVYQNLPEGPKNQALVRFLWWSIHQGQQTAPSLDYAPLPSDIVTRVEKILRTVQVGGKPALSNAT